MGIHTMKKVAPFGAAAPFNPISDVGGLPGWWSFAWWNTAAEVLLNGGNLNNTSDAPPSFTDAVKVIVDQSGNGENFTQASAGLEATWENVGNGTLDFLGSNESYNFDAQVPLFAGDGTRSRMEFYALILVDRDTVDQTLWEYSDTDVAGDEKARIWINNIASANWELTLSTGSGTCVIDLGGTPNDGTYHIVHAYYDDTNMQVEWDALSNTDALAAPSTAANDGRFGARSSGTQFLAFNCMAVFFVSGGNLDATERANMFTFLTGLKP